MTRHGDFSDSSDSMSTTKVSSRQKHDTNDLRRVRDSVPWRLWAVAAISLFERAAFWALLAPWQNYMENPPSSDKDHPPGALGLGQALATRIYCCFYIFYYVTPIFVAFVADSKLGQYKSLIISTVLYCLGIVAVTVTAIPANIEKGWGLPGLIVAMFLVGLGGGGVKAILPAFLADQYEKKEAQIRTLKSGEKVVTDDELTLTYIYNLYFWIGNVGSLSWFAVVFIEKHSGFVQAYGFTLGLMVCSLIALIVGKPWFVLRSHEDNLIVAQAAKIVACAARNGFKMKHAEPEYQLERHCKTVSWTASMVGELTRGLKACRVLFTFVTFYVCFDQMQNNLISQAGQMKLGTTPNDLVGAMNQVGCIIMGPLIQEVLYPFLHRRRIYIGPIMRITIGFGITVLAMLYATFVQHAIYSAPPCYDNPANCAVASSPANLPNVWIQAPIYFIMAIGEIFCMVTALEYAYEYSPKDMKVIVQAINLLVAGLGSVVALALTAVANDPKLVIFYASLASAMALTTFLFWVVYRHYDRNPASPGKDQLSNCSTIDVELGTEKAGHTGEGKTTDVAGSTLEAGDAKKGPAVIVTERYTKDSIALQQNTSEVTLVQAKSENN
ncbi:major facilitator superfamily domain-containing protein [Ampelomyces quisqualis]|uniref:Major facilitator superfamily domain-containing protein n=1 Tax=Ampelomyces quisqualis TaxID=50730 RepID=A0A6A5QU51_AMPQU|nr:major facilitator superfamily domain-containing protein [Ampelomyces quisqualis]